MATTNRARCPINPVIATAAQWRANRCPADPDRTRVAAELAYERPAGSTRLMDAQRSDHLREVAANA